MAHSRPQTLIRPEVRYGSIASVCRHPSHVRFPPDSDRIADIALGPKSAKLGSRRFNHLVQRGRLLRTCRESDHRSGVPQDAARFRKTISLARSTKARKLAAIWRRPG